MTKHIDTIDTVSSISITPSSFLIFAFIPPTLQTICVAEVVYIFARVFFNYKE